MNNNTFSTTTHHARAQSLPPYVKSISPISIPSSDTKEYAHIGGGRNVRQPWLPDHQAQGCMEPGCPTIFSITERRHHCRCCGKIFCSTHTGYQSLICSDVSVDRVCNTCFSLEESKTKDHYGGGVSTTTTTSSSNSNGIGGKHSITNSAGFLHYVSRESLQEKQVINDSVPSLEPGTVASNAFIAGVEITHALEPAYIVDVRARRRRNSNNNDNINSNNNYVDGDSPPFHNNGNNHYYTNINNNKKYNVWCVRRHFSDFLYLVKTMKYGIDLSNFRKSTPDLNDPYALKSSIELLNNVLALCLRSKWRTNITVQTFLCDSPMRRNHVVPKEIIGKQLIEKGNLDSFPLVVLRAEIMDGNKSPHVAFVICTRSIQNYHDRNNNNNNDEGEEVFHIVKRRYTYFQILNQQLKKKFPKRSKIGKALPSLPGKSMDPIGGARFHAARIEKKRFNLELYLHELLLIPEVRVSNELKTFLGVTPVPLGVHTTNHNKSSRSNNIIQHEVKNNINNNLKSFIDITNNNHTNVNETKANVMNDRNISENNGESLQTIENENQHGFGGDDDDDNEGDINVISNNNNNNNNSNKKKKVDEYQDVNNDMDEDQQYHNSVEQASLSSNNNNKKMSDESSGKNKLSDKEEDVRKTKTAKFIAELLKRSLEAKLDLAAKESEYEALKKELNVVKTECVNERTLRLAAEKEILDLRKQLGNLQKKNEKYPRGLGQYWQEK